MSINVGQIFVNFGNLRLAMRVATEYIRRWERGTYRKLSGIEKREQGAENFLNRMSRRVVMLAPLNGWIALQESVRFLADAELSRHMSESLGCRVIWLEVQGGALGWSCFEFNNGQLTDGRLDPLAGREPRLLTAARAAGLVNGYPEFEPDMPRYPVEPEIDAWHHLLSLGLPAERIFVYPRDIRRMLSGGNTDAGYITLKSSRSGGRVLAAISRAAVSDRPPGPPFKTDLVVRKSGEPMEVHEVRLLHGNATRAGIESARAAEEAWRRRAFWALSAAAPARVPIVTFRYRDPTNPERKLDELLARQGGSGRSPFCEWTATGQVLSLCGFAAEACRLTGAAAPAADPRVDSAGRLTAACGTARLPVDLGPAYRAYLAAPGETAAIVSAAVAEAMACHAVNQALSPTDRERLCLLVLPDGRLPAEAVSSRLGPGLYRVLAVEIDGRFWPVTAAAIETRIGLAADSALRLAAARLDVLAGAASIGEAAEDAGTVVAPQPLPASSLLAWPGLQNLIGQQAGGAAAAAVPAEDLVLWAPATAERERQFRMAAARAFDRARLPVCETAFKWGPAGLEVL